MNGPQILNEDQETALREILESYRERRDHVLVGAAGTGKTTLTQAIVDVLGNYPSARIAVTAPTHKAVQAVKSKLEEAGFRLGTLDRRVRGNGEGPTLAALTIHSYLGLKVDINEAGRQILVKESHGYIDDFNVVIIDECSMIGTILQKHIDKDLDGDHWVLYVGDAAQLPPVGEQFAICFNTPNQSKLTHIVRQAENNLLLVAATNLRRQQEKGSALDLSWAKTAMRDGLGILDLGGDDAAAMENMRACFTSEEFEQDNDSFRVLSYTNEMVRALNTLIRFWIYGETESPFVLGERVLCRSPVADCLRADMIIINTNEEAVVTGIKEGKAIFRFEDVGPGAPLWTEELPVWVVELTVPDTDRSATCYIALDPVREEALFARLRAEAIASGAKVRWWYRFNLRRVLPDLRPIYAMTIHTSQGSTFGNVFVNLRDCVRFANKKAPLETQQLLYTAITRPRYTVTLIGDVVPYVPVKRQAAAPKPRTSGPGPDVPGWGNM